MNFKVIVIAETTENYFSMEDCVFKPYKPL